jgi:putative oxidoreductase
MKIAITIASVLLGLPFLIFGLNYFVNFMPVPPMTGNPAIFMSLFGPTGYMAVVKTLEVILAISILSGIYRPLALILIAPIAVNILLFEVFIAGMPGIGILLVSLIAFLLYAYREKYLPIVR